MTTGDEEYRFLPDEPIESIQEDEFRHQEYVDTLEEMVRSVNPPWNIGVFGEWGSGKTSIIKMLFSRLNDADQSYVCVEFDAWKHAEESLRTDLLLNLDQVLGEEAGTEVDGKPGVLGEDQITQELYDVEESEDRVKDERGNIEALNHFFRDEKYVASTILGVTFISLVAGIFVSPSVGAGVFTVIVAPLLLHMSKQLSNATDTLQRKFLYPRKEWSGAYEQLFNDIIDETDADKVVISIDNLDRCESETVYDVLVSLKTFLEQDDCIYIIPCDDKALQSHIESIDEQGEYFDKEPNGQEFLRKFFQTHLRIPQFIPEDIEEYASSQNEALDQPFGEDVLDVITKAYVKNPRRIKQSLNRLATLRLLAEQIEEEGYLSDGTLTGELAFLAKIAVLEEDHPNAYSKIQSDPGLLQDINEYLRGGLDEDESKKVEEVLYTQDELRSGESGLERFLRATRPYTVENPKPFLRLGEPSYASQAANTQEFVQNLRTSQLEAVREKLDSSETGSQEIKAYITAIQSALDELTRSNRRGALQSTIIATVTVYESFGDQKEIVARILGRFLDLELTSEVYSDVDPSEFFPVVLDIPLRNRRDVFNRFARSATSGGKLRENTLEVFVDNAESVPSYAAETLCNVILETDQLEKALKILSTNSDSRDLATPDLLGAAADLTNWEGRQNDFVEYKHYTQFDTEAEPRARKHYVQRLLTLEDQVEDNNQSQYFSNLSQRLQELSGQIDRETGSELFSVLQRGVNSNSGPQIRLVKNTITFYPSYEASIKDDFHDWIANQLSNWNQNRSQQIFKHARDNGVDLFKHDETVKNILNQIPSTIEDPSFTSSVIVDGIPDKYNEELSELFVELSESSDEDENVLAAEIFVDHPDRFSSVRDSLLEKFRSQAQRTNNSKNKRSFLEAELAVYEDLDPAEQESFNNQLRKLLSGNRNDHREFKNIWSDAEEKLSSESRTSVARDIRSQLASEFEGNIQANQIFPLIEVFQSLVATGDVDGEDGEWAIERLSNEFDGNNLNHNQVSQLMDHLTEFNDLFGMESKVLSRASSCVSNNRNNKVQTSAKDLIKSLEESGKLSEEEINEARSRFE